MQDRLKTFESVRNFRDFGGYTGAGGKKVRTGTLYRSAQFGEATDTDMAKLNGLNIKVQADLRRPDERDRHGHRWPVNGVNVLSSDLGKADQAPHVRFLSEVEVDVAKAKQWMIDYYCEAPFRDALVETYRNWFKALQTLEVGEAAVVNCAAGKDRTGILCALTHHVLGVDRGTIFEDYELTNTAADVAGRLPALARQFNDHTGKAYPKEVYQPFVGVDTEFLSAAFSTIENRSGSLDTYLAETLSIDAAEQEHLQNKLLE